MLVATVCTAAIAGHYTTDGSGNPKNGAAAAQEACASGFYSSAGATVCTEVTADSQSQQQPSELPPSKAAASPNSLHELNL